ncbi:hypothetical protein J2S34_002232 [Nitrobacter winogradskyi]|uniref:Uncharacterized protein n=1 Tax=Nitrobacter winogradskyi TaxID=913 RepID=A0ACC6AJ46_NITWI|nr:hypothetical protein [Nitrobacter winogradskyi]
MKFVASGTREAAESAGAGKLLHWMPQALRSAVWRW